MRKSTVDRFWEKVDIHGPDECWPWLACQSSNGYGKFRFGGKPEWAHRVAWQLVHGDIPLGVCVCHHCDNPACVNPNHLFLGTKADNTHDMMAKGRANFTGGSRVGEDNPNSKLTEKQVLEIIELDRAKEIPRREIAKRYGICRTHIYDILSGERWGETTGIVFEG